MWRVVEKTDPDFAEAKRLIVAEIAVSLHAQALAGGQVASGVGRLPLGVTAWQLMHRPPQDMLNLLPKEIPPGLGRAETAWLSLSCPLGIRAPTLRWRRIRDRAYGLLNQAVLRATPGPGNSAAHLRHM